MLKCEYLILGGGIAGFTAAETLRKFLPDAEIGLISEEQHPLYSRVLLPHYIKGKIPRERVFLRSGDHLAKYNIRVRMGHFAASINARDKKVILDNGEEIKFGKLLIATGGRTDFRFSRQSGIPPFPFKNIYEAAGQISDFRFHPFRTIEDADKIIADLQVLPKGAPCAALGSSFIALEFPSIFEHFGMKTIMSMRGPGFFHRILDSDSMALIENEISAHGGTVLKNQTDLQTINAPFYGLGLGMKRNMDFAVFSGVTANIGILTNEYLETNVPGIWAVGDVAEFYDVIGGKQRVAGNWMTAEAQGRLAAANMIGERTRFEMVSSYSMPIFNLTITFVGDVEVDEETKIIIRGSRETKSLVRVLIKDGIIRGATLLGRNSDRGPITELIKNRIKIDDMRPLEDKSFDLKKLA